MLNTAEVSSTIPGYVKYANQMHFTLPEDPAWPILMIAAGSGIAPFRGFWLKRWEQHLEGHTVGKTLLYFGCRKKTMNLFKNETDSVSLSNQRWETSVAKFDFYLLGILVSSRKCSALMLEPLISSVRWPTPGRQTTRSSMFRT